MSFLSQIQLPPRASYIVGGAVGYALLGKVLLHTGQLVFGAAKWAEMSAERKERAVLYMLSLINAGLMTTLGVREINDIRKQLPREAGEPFLDYCNRVSLEGTKSEERLARSYGYLNMLCGYMLHDFFRTIQDWAKYKDQWLHHVLSLGLLLSLFSFAQRPDVRHYVGVGSSILLIETSTVPLNVMWLMKEAGRGEGLPVKICALLFVLCFATLRLVGAPNLVFRLIYRWPKIDQPMFGLVRPLLAGAVGLQFFWAYRIALALRSGRMG